MERFQRRLSALYGRFASQGSGGRVEIPDVVLGTISLGSERTDTERVVFSATFDLTTGAGSFPGVAIEATSRDTELVAVWASRPGGGLNLGFDFRDAFFPPGALPSNSTNGVPATSRCTGTGFGATSVTASLEAPTDTALFLPLAGVVIPRGRALFFESDAAASSMRAGVLWRELEVAE